MWESGRQIGWLLLAGALGTLCRYVLAGLVQQLLAKQFPWGTLVVNVLGCFLFGLFWSWAEEHVAVTAQLRLIVLTGFLGAFTTFSTFAFETSQLVQNSQWLKAALNLIANNGLGILAVYAGFSLGRAA